MKQLTIILTVPVSVSVADDKDIDTICDNLSGIIASAHNNGKITEGCHDDTSIDQEPDVDTEVCDDEEDEDEDSTAATLGVPLSAEGAVAGVCDAVCIVVCSGT